MNGSPLSADLAGFIEGPTLLYLATRDASQQPDSVGAIAAKIDPDRAGLTVYLAEVVAEWTLANARANGELALAVVRPTDNRAVQVKGRYLSDAPVGEIDRGYVEHHLEMKARELGLVGVPRPIARSFVIWPAVALRMSIREVYTQTPGPAAGRRLDGAGAR